MEREKYYIYRERERELSIYLSISQKPRLSQMGLIGTSGRHEGNDGVAMKRTVALLQPVLDFFGGGWGGGSGGSHGTHPQTYDI